MARVIEFYIPTKFRRKGPSVPQSPPGKVIVLLSAKEISVVRSSDLLTDGGV